MKAVYIKRALEKELTRLSALYSAVVVTGPRQSGKTTLCKNVFPDHHYVNLEDVGLREQISLEPKAFLKQYASGLIMDEIQQYPELFSYIQVVVDEMPQARFVLTGSSNFALLAKVTQSLAGRAATLTLLPLALSELDDLTELTTDHLIRSGGYPAVWSRNIPANDASRNYYNTYIERDVRQLLNIKDMLRFQTFIRLCAGRTGSEFNASALSNETGVAVPTIREWLSVLEASYVVLRLPPFFRNVGKRLVKTPKLYFCDTGLACFLLGIETDDQLATHPLRGALFENLVVLEFYKSQLHRGKLPNLYFYKDKSQREVDLIREHGSKLHAYEIKSARRFHKSFADNLQYFKRIAGEDVASTNVIYDGEVNSDFTFNRTLNFRDLPGHPDI